MIVFEKIRWKNILSTGNHFEEIILNKSPSTLIMGKNGSGKSTVLDALCFVLFGKPFRKVNKPLVLNSINSSNLVVEVEFSIGTKKYKVSRGMKPNVFEILVNGVLLNQDATSRDYQEVLERSILKLNFKSFTQIVILGSASFTPFMQLLPAPRREIIEDLLDIQIFSSMNVLVKQRISTLKDEIDTNKDDIKLSSEKIKMQKEHIQITKKVNEGEIDKKEEEIEDNEKQIQSLSTDIELIQRHVEALTRQVGDKLKLEKRNKKLIQLESKLETRKNILKKEIVFYEDNDACPTCQQTIDKDFKLSAIQSRSIKKTELENGLKEIEEEINKTSIRLTEIQNILVNINNHNSEIVKHNTSIIAIRQYIYKLEKEIEELKNRKDDSEFWNEKLNELKGELDKLTETQGELSTERYYLEYTSNLLKDTGIKANIIKQYLPIMNKLINKYLQAMNSFINFNLNENFEEIIKSRHRDTFVYNLFSGGEKMRIDLSILMTWRQVAKLKNSVNTNLLFLDEIFDSSLELEGIEDFMTLMKTVGTGINVFVISHRGDQFLDRFQNVIRFIKRNNFSCIE